MTVSEFLDLFVKELEINSNLHGYYRMLENKSRFLWRKSYLEQRLEYVRSQLTRPYSMVWDVGCGYGTTGIFLALNGHQVLGTTLEFYYSKIGDRLSYWKQFGNLDGLKIEYANLYDMQVSPRQFDAIIAQDTLHHLEPVKQAMDIFKVSLKPDGKLIVLEENGNNIFIILKNFAKRGFSRVTSYYDENLHKTIRIGNENARSLQAWKEILRDAGFTFSTKEREYIRFYPPWYYTTENYPQVIIKEKNAGKKVDLLRELLFFGINFTAINSKP